MSAPVSQSADVGHTPLPWVIAPDCAFSDGNAHIVYPGPGLSPGEGVNAFELEYVAECGHGDRARADAELICRAVNAHADLLAALQGLLHNYGSKKAQDAARAAIAKAKGAQS